MMHLLRLRLLAGALVGFRSPQERTEQGQEQRDHRREERLHASSRVILHAPNGGLPGKHAARHASNAVVIG
jgi:hypothetical protein